MTDTSDMPSRKVSPIWGVLGWLLAILTVGGLYLLWWLAVQGFGKIVPSPHDVFDKLGELLDSGQFWAALGATLTGWAIGFVVGGILGLAVGIPGSRSRAVGSFFGPVLLVVLAFPIPLAAILAMMWQGLNGDIGRILSAALVTVVVVATALIAAQKEGGGAGFWRGVFRCLALAAVVALAMVLFVEMIVGGQKLGAMITLSATSFDMARVVALGLVVWVLGVVVASPFLLIGWVCALVGGSGDRYE